MALFSTDFGRIQQAYQRLITETDIFAEISIYWKRILGDLFKEIQTMFTKEVFLRDCPPDADSEILLPWQIKELLRQQAEE